MRSDFWNYAQQNLILFEIMRFYKMVKYAIIIIIIIMFEHHSDMTVLRLLGRKTMQWKRAEKHVLMHKMCIQNTEINF